MAVETLLYLSHEDTEKLNIRMKDVAPIFEELYRVLAEGQAVFPRRVRLVHPPLREGERRGSALGAGPARVAGDGAGDGHRLPAGGTARGHGSGVALMYWDFETMALKCIISDELVHGVRSAAPDAPLTKYLARPDASILAVIGTGRIARWAAEAAWSQRRIEEVRVYSRDPQHRQAFCHYVEERMQTPAVDCQSSDEAVSEADVVVMATSTRVPVINGAALRAGTTVISNTPEELDRESIRRANRIVVTAREEIVTHVPPWQAVYEAIRDREVDSEQLVELPDIIVGRAPGRTSDDEIVVCMNAGNGVHDVAAARFTYLRALDKGLGTTLPV